MNCLSRSLFYPLESWYSVISFPFAETSCLYSAYSKLKAYELTRWGLLVSWKPDVLIHRHCCTYDPVEVLKEQDNGRWGDLQQVKQKTTCSGSASNRLSELSRSLHLSNAYFTTIHKRHPWPIVSYNFPVWPGWLFGYVNVNQTIRSSSVDFSIASCALVSSENRR
jgi:hypothetical protein